jgi:hypothetical protein
MADQKQATLPENFHSIIIDFIRDLNITFPEYSYLWAKWGDPALPQSELVFLFNYVLSVFPERFFDILYQNADMFKADSAINTTFLPNVEFKLLFNCENVSKNTQKAMWKYLQLILFSVINSVKDKSNFGDSMNLFDGVDEAELQQKISETMGSIGDFFSNMEKDGKEAGAESGKETASDENISMDELERQFKAAAETIFNQGKSEGNQGKGTEKGTEKGMEQESGQNPFNFDKMPNADELHGHLKGLFNGKIGSLAKELAEEISNDLPGIFGEEMGEMRSTQDVLQKIIKNPKKIMELMKTVGNKLNTKMKSGEISQEEIMKEAGELMGKMKDMGGTDQFAEIFKNMTKNMGGLGKGAKLDVNAMARMEKQMSTRERMRNKLAAKQQASASAPIPSNFTLETKNANNLVYRPANSDVQEKSSAKPTSSNTGANDDIDKIMKDLNLTNEIQVNVDKKKKKKSGKK